MKASRDAVDESDALEVRDDASQIRGSKELVILRAMPAKEPRMLEIADVRRNGFTCPLQYAGGEFLTPEGLHVKLRMFHYYAHAVQ